MTAAQGSIMAGVALCVVGLGVPPVVAQGCFPITTGVQYCGDRQTGPQFITEVIFPDLVANFTLQEDPLVTSAVVTMPYDRQIGSWDDILAMVGKQMMELGSAPHASLSDESYSAGMLDGVNSARVELLGRHADGRIMAAYVIEAAPATDGVLMIFTNSETRDAVDDDLRALHNGFIAGFEVRQ